MSGAAFADYRRCQRMTAIQISIVAQMAAANNASRVMSYEFLHTAE